MELKYTGQCLIYPKIITSEIIKFLLFVLNKNINVRVLASESQTSSYNNVALKFIAEEKKLIIKILQEKSLEYRHLYFAEVL